MKILRHILSHLFFIFFLVAITSVFYYRTLLLPSDVVEKVDGIVNEVYPPALKFVSNRDYFWSIAGERIVSFDDLTIFEKNSEVASNNKTEDVTKVELSVQPETKIIEVVEKEVGPDSQVKKEEVVVIAKVDDVEATNKIVAAPKAAKPVVAVPEAVKATIVEAKVTKELIAEPKAVKEPIAELPKENSQTEELPVEVKDSDTSSERELLVNARNAFNRGAMAESEKIYLELTQLDNDSPDNFGELGNVYYSQGQWDKAGQAYYEAAVRLMTEGNYKQVSYLQRVIRGLNAEHAEKLSQLMMKQ